MPHGARRRHRPGLSRGPAVAYPWLAMRQFRRSTGPHGLRRARTGAVRAQNTRGGGCPRLVWFRTPVGGPEVDGRPRRAGRPGLATRGAALRTGPGLVASASLLLIRVPGHPVATPDEARRPARRLGPHSGRLGRLPGTFLGPLLQSLFRLRGGTHPLQEGNRQSRPGDLGRRTRPVIHPPHPARQPRRSTGRVPSPAQSRPDLCWPHTGMFRTRSMPSLAVLILSEPGVTTCRTTVGRVLGRRGKCRRRRPIRLGSAPRQRNTVFLFHLANPLGGACGGCLPWLQRSTREVTFQPESPDVTKALRNGTRLPSPGLGVSRND
jgi:hypothetical protein